MGCVRGWLDGLLEDGLMGCVRGWLDGLLEDTLEDVLIVYEDSMCR